MTPAYVLAGVLFTAWVAVVAWAIRGDRSRGRRRCPRCFYPLGEGASLACPECGHTARSEAATLRTRRYWRAGVLACLVLLLPAAALAVFARLSQTKGWADLPGWVAVRLLGLDEPSLDDDVIRRIRAATLGHASCERVVVEGCDRLRSIDPARRATGFTLLEGVARNSYSQGASDPRRPMLEELRPGLSVPRLVALAGGADSGEAARAIGLLSHLRDADEEANLAVLRALASPDDLLRGEAQAAISYAWRSSATVKRLPNPPMLRLRFRGDPRQAKAEEELLARMAGGVIDRGDDRSAIRAWARGVALGEMPCEPGLDTAMWQAWGLWLWCRFDAFGEDAWRGVTLALADADPLVRENAIRQAAGFGWSDAVRAALEAAIRDPGEHVRTTALDSAARFGREASPLVPVFLEYAADPHRMGGSSAFPVEFNAVGGEARELARVLADRLESEAQGDGFRSVAGVTASLWWLADLEIRDERAAAIVLRYANEHAVASIRVTAAVAYAALSGDGERATDRVLRETPDFTRPLILGSAQQALFTLIRDGTADAGAILAHISGAGPEQQAGFVSLLDQFVPGRSLGDYEPWIRTQVANPSCSATAKKLLARIEGAK